MWYIEMKVCQIIPSKTVHKQKKVNYAIVSNHILMVLFAHNPTYRTNLCHDVSTCRVHQHHISFRVLMMTLARNALWMKSTGFGELFQESYMSAFYIFSFYFSSSVLKGHPQWCGSANEMSQPRELVQRGWREDSGAQSSSFSARLCLLRAKSQSSELRHQSLWKAPGTSSVIAAFAVWIEKCQQDY